MKIDLAMGVFERKLQMKACHFRLISNGNKQRNVFPATFNKDSHLHYCKGKKNNRKVTTRRNRISVAPNFL